MEESTPVTVTWCHCESHHEYHVHTNCEATDQESCVATDQESCGATDQEYQVSKKLAPAIMEEYTFNS